MNRTASRLVVVLVSLTLSALAAALPADALAAASHHHRRHHRRAHVHRRRTRARRRAARARRGPAPSHPGSTNACPTSGVSVRTGSLDTMRAAVICEINLARAAHGLPALSDSGELDNAAQGWSQAMAAAHQLSHGASFSARISAAGYSWGSAGENIASGYATPRSVVSGWMASVDHCRNILTPSFRDVGIGEVPGSMSAGVGPGTWTADFGLRLLQSAPSGNWGPANGCPY